ncbi:MAG: formylglycine-generating enzyme family protein [Planctomycetota bacterium]|nr:formylglycine-generating enzyme family protein [Planctomycetota bacterium]
MKSFVLSGIIAGLPLCIHAELGIQKERPADGRCVQVEQGYMVAYCALIPGSEIEYEMVPCPGGSYFLGSPESEPGRKSDEGPQAEVRVAPFWIGKYEITWKQFWLYTELILAFEQFEDKGIRKIENKYGADVVTAASKIYDTSFTYKKGKEPQHPAVTMSQYGAKQYTKWLSLLTRRFYRLPSEVEWEHACRAGTKTACSFGNDPKKLGEYAWFAENSDGRLQKVGTKKPNAWGLHDMHGGVAEWVLDHYRKDRYSKLKDRPLNPIAWPDELYPRVIRGGSWKDPAEATRSAARYPSNDDKLKANDPNSPMSPWWLASNRGLAIGFRFVRPIEAPDGAERLKYWDADVDEIREDVDQRIEEEGKGKRGRVDPSLPQAIKALEK